MRNILTFIVSITLVAAACWALDPISKPGKAPIATTTRAGLVKPSTGLSVAADGTLTTTGVPSLTDSVSTTSSTTAASATAVKAAYDEAHAKVASVTGSGAVHVTTGTTPTVSLTSVPFGNLSSALRNPTAWAQGGFFYNMSTALGHRIR